MKNVPRKAAATAVERQLAAILHTDAVDYSRLMSVDEAGAMRLLNTHRAAIDRAIAYYRGRIANTAGDSVLAAFPSAVDALQCALLFQEHIHLGNSETTNDRRIDFRVGLHVAEVMVRKAATMADRLRGRGRARLLPSAGHCFRTVLASFERLRLLVGRTAYDLRRHKNVTANRRGRVQTSIELPEWARPGRRVFFALQSFDGRRRAAAGPFRVIERPKPAQPLTVRGTIVTGGAECALFRSDDGRRFSLTGNLRGFGPGDRVTVRGRVAEVSTCMQGPTLAVQRISKGE